MNEITLELSTKPSLYPQDQLERAFKLAEWLDRGTLVLIEPPRKPR